MSRPIGRHGPTLPAPIVAPPSPVEHVACPVCGTALDFGDSDEFGRVLERCHTCHTVRLMPRGVAPPPGEIRAHGNQGGKRASQGRKRASWEWEIQQRWV
jgi:hypothetical protein